MKHLPLWSAILIFFKVLSIKCTCGNGCLVPRSHYSARPKRFGLVQANHQSELTERDWESAVRWHLLDLIFIPSMREARYIWNQDSHPQGQVVFHKLIICTLYFWGLYVFKNSLQLQYSLHATESCLNLHRWNQLFSANFPLLPFHFLERNENEIMHRSTTTAKTCVFETRWPPVR